MIATLDALAGLTAPGSSLLLHHIVAPPADQPRPSLLSNLRTAPFMLYLRYCGEEIKFYGWRSEQISHALEARGWKLVEDASLSQHARQLDLPAATIASVDRGGWGKWEERIAVAERFRRPDAHVGEA